MISDQIELNVLKSIELPTGEISDSAIMNVKRYFLNTTWKMGKEVWLPSDWDWSWQLGKGHPYVGTLPKRLSKLAHENGIELTSEDLATIGTFAKNGQNNESVTYYDFTDRFDWEDGSYGDWHSCLWNSSGRALYNMMAANVIAFRVYKPIDEIPLEDREDAERRVKNSLTYGGVGRCWLMCDTPYNDTLVLWNGYGPWNNASQHYARVLSYILGLSYKHIQIPNNLAYVWVNSGSGYMLGTQSQLESVNDIELDIPDMGE